MGERFDPSIGGGKAAFPCVQLHLNHCPNPISNPNRNSNPKLL